MNEAPETQEAAVEEVSTGAFMIETTDQFAHLMMEWHSNAMATIRHMMEVPTGMEVVIEDEPPFKMEGDIQKGYKLGLNVAMNYFGVLPFASTPEPDESQPN